MIKDIKIKNKLENPSENSKINNVKIRKTNSKETDERNFVIDWIIIKLMDIINNK